MKGVKAHSALAIFYEHPRWFEPLFAELDKRGAPYVKLDAANHFFEPGVLGDEKEFSLVLNRMSPSADRRGSGASILYTVHYLLHLEMLGKRVINGSKAFRYEVSKSFQLSLLAKLGLPYPKARTIQDPCQAPAATPGLRFPVVIKPNVGGSGAGVIRFDSAKDLADAVTEGRVELGLDRIGLVQEFIPARGGHITRVEVLDGRFFYAIKVFLAGQSFDLCPADICQTDTRDAAGNACPANAAGLVVENYRPPANVIADVERITREAGIEVGGVEYVIDDRDGQIYYYDINALSNFVANAEQVIGFDPFVSLADFLERQAEAVS